MGISIVGDCVACSVGDFVNLSVSAVSYILPCFCLSFLHFYLLEFPLNYHLNAFPSGVLCSGFLVVDVSIASPIITDVTPPLPPLM